MTPHEFCHWLRGYTTGRPGSVNLVVRDELEKVDLTVLPWYVPVAPEDPPPTPSSPPAPPSNLSRRGHYGTTNGYPIPAPMIQTPPN